MLTIMIRVDLICDSCDGNKQGRTCAGPAFPCPLCVRSPLFQDMQLCIMHYAMHYSYKVLNCTICTVCPLNMHCNMLIMPLLYVLYYCILEILSKNGRDLIQ